MKHFRKRMLANGLAMALVISSLAAIPAAAANNIDFKDIKGHWAETHIKNFLEKGYIEGYGDNTFRPDNKITRAEFIKIVNMAFGYTTKGSENFTDVNSDDWFYDEVLKAMKQGYIDGYGDDTFKPNEPISREEACKIVGVILKANGYGNTKFKDDSEIQDWAKKYVKGLVDMGIIDGFKEDNTFRPKANTSRAETVKTVKGASEYKPSTGGGSNGDGSNINLNPTISSESDLNNLDKTVQYESINMSMADASTLDGIKAKTITVNSGVVTLKDCTIGTLNIGKSSSARINSNNAITVSAVGATSLNNVNINSLSVLNVQSNITINNLNVGENAGGTEIKGDGSIVNATINAPIATDIEFSGTVVGNDNIKDIIKVETSKQLLDSIESAKEGDIIEVNGTIGSVEDHTNYEIKKPIIIRGMENNKLYGSFQILTDGVKIEGLNIENKGGVHPHKNAIDVVANQVTLTGNSFTLGQGLESGYVANGITIWPYGDSKQQYNISGNTFNGYTGNSNDWSSSAIVIAEEIELSRFGNDYKGKTSATASIENEEAFALSNKYQGCKYNYVRQNWGSEHKGNHMFTYSSASIPTSITATNGTILFDGVVGSTEEFKPHEIKKSMTIKGLEGNQVYGSFQILVDGVRIEGLNIENKGGVHPDKNAIDVVASQVTLIDNSFTLGQVLESGYVANGITIWPYGNSEQQYNISGNTFNGYTGNSNDWSSSAIVIAEEIELSRFGNDYKGEKSVIANINDEKNFALSNKYNGCKYNYVRQNWSSEQNGNHMFTYSSVSIPASITAKNGTILFDGNLELKNDLNIPESVQVYLINNGILAIGEEATLTVDGELIALDDAKIINSENINGSGSWPGKVNVE